MRGAATREKKKVAKRARNAMETNMKSKYRMHGPHMHHRGPCDACGAPPRLPSLGYGWGFCLSLGGERAFQRCLDLPAHVAANDDVAAEDGAGHVLLAERVRDDGRGHGELHRRGVDDADDVARSRRLEDAEEGAVEALMQSYF